MVGIVDIFGATEKVQIAPGKDIEFIGWSARAVASLLRRFPFLQDTLNGKPMTLAGMIQTDPAAAGAALAAGFKGGLENPEIEEQMSDLPLQTQVDCFMAIQKISFPKGLVPFLISLYALSPRQPGTSSPEDTSTPSNSSAAARTNGPMEPDTSMPDMTSPRPSSDSAATDGPPSGISRPAN